jgi:hypothetical protein
MKDAQFRPLIVFDFVCDHCGQKLDAIVVARVGTTKKIAKTYHADCWEKNIKPQTNFVEGRKAGAN